ncbi:alpha/beta fold hydrolase [Micromonospora craniellae]|uniref:alpha/beta fold hydrolase n=1 Tax=Micromonospora craniellae TaxID=2294034 RepID=UPI0018F1B7CA|nr:alpha/beta hydrolase [Micromonospora craniellae]
MIFLHQTPRSWDEYRDVLPIVGRAARVLAMDTVGYGASARLDVAQTMELFADGVEDVIEGLGLDRPVLVGHHTGGVVALEVAARRGPSVAGLVLSGTPYVDEARRRLVAASRPPIDHVELTEDGSHLTELWNRRRPFYPPDRPDLLSRFVADACRVIEQAEEGHVAVNTYRMEERIGLVTAPTLVICGELDDFSMPDVPRLVSAIPGSRARVLPGTGVPAVDHHPEAFAAEVLAFLREIGSARA